MLCLPPWYLHRSAQELSAFISGTHPRLGHGSLPRRLAEREPHILRLVARFLLERCVPFFASIGDGHIACIQVSVRDSVVARGNDGEATRVSRGNSGIELALSVSRLVDICSVSAESRKESDDFINDATSGHQSCASVVVAIAADATWLVVGLASGSLVVFPQTSCMQREETIHLGRPLTTQNLILAAGVVIVAAKRALMIVDLESKRITTTVAIPFSASPCIAVDGCSIFAKCDEVVRMWHFPLEDHGSSVRPTSFPDPVDLERPHAQLLVGMALQKGCRLLVTASPEEIRGWCWDPAANMDDPAKLLWTLPVCIAAGPIVSQGAFESHTGLQVLSVALLETEDDRADFDGHGKLLIMIAGCRNRHPRLCIADLRPSGGIADSWQPIPRRCLDALDELSAPCLLVAQAMSLSTCRMSPNSVGASVGASVILWTGKAPAGSGMVAWLVDPLSGRSLCPPCLQLATNGSTFSGITALAVGPIASEPSGALVAAQRLAAVLRCLS